MINFFVELAKVAFEALKTDKLVFTLTEISESCPNLTMTTDNWNGLGLLKAVQYFCAEMGNNQVTFHFLHFSIQEYMAAWYISTLSDSKQIKLLQKTFWEHRYYNTWIMYVGITCGSSFALRHFLSGNRFQLYTKFFGASTVSNKFLKHKMKCLHLFQCFVEVNKEDAIESESVKLFFENKQIDLSHQTLLPSDLNTLGSFLIKSINKEWDYFNLSNCNIGSNGSNILCDTFMDKDVRCMVNIKMVNFSYNQLNFISLRRLFVLFNSWHTSEIIITADAKLDSTIDIKAIEDIVLQSSTLVLVHIISFLFCKNIEEVKVLRVLLRTTKIASIYLLNCTWMSSASETAELLALLGKQKLNKACIIGPSLDKYYIIRLVLILLNNNDSVNMFVYDPTMFDQIADDISSLILSLNKDISGVMLIVSSSKVQGIVNTCSLSNELSTLEIFNFSIYVRHLNNKLCKWREHLGSEVVYSRECIFTFIQLLYKIDFNWKVKITLWENDIMILHKAEFESLDKFISSTNKISAIYLSSCDINELKYDLMKITYSTLHIFNSPDYVELLHTELLHKKVVPNKLFIYGNFKDILMNSFIEQLLHNQHNISANVAANGIIVGIHPNSEQIAQTIQLQPLPTTWILSTTGNTSILYQVIDALTVLPAEWTELNFTGCSIGDIECDVMHRNFRSKKCSTVRKLSISLSKLSISGMHNFVNIVSIWGVRELNINGPDDVSLDHFINNFTFQHQSDFLSITYNQKVLQIICNTSLNKMTTKMNTQAFGLCIIN